MQKIMNSRQVENSVIGLDRTDFRRDFYRRNGICSSVCNDSSGWGGGRYGMILERRGEKYGKKI